MRMAEVKKQSQSMRPGEPLVRDRGVVVGGRGEDVGGGDGVGGPDDLAGLEVPPQVGVVEARPHGEHCEHDKEAGNGYREGEDPIEDPRPRQHWTWSGGRWCCGHAISSLGFSDSPTNSGPAPRMRRWR